jgi:hypothetical protein
VDDASGALGKFGPAELAHSTRELDERGYYVFEQRLPEPLCDRLLEFGLTGRCMLRPMRAPGAPSEPVLVDRYPRSEPAGVRYDFSAQDVIDNPDVQGLMADRSIIAVAQSYLRCRPLIDVMSMWWHTGFSNRPDEEAAQYWHFDMDRIKWLKFFIYLTDVGPKNGPHSFVEGSHKRNGLHPSLRVKGYTRLTDEEVARCYPKDKFVEFAAPRGTVIAEDTRGLHKGKHVTQGDRLILQLQFSNSLFGGYYPPTRCSHVANPDLRTMIQRYPRMYSNYLN